VGIGVEGAVEAWSERSRVYDDGDEGWSAKETNAVAVVGIEDDAGGVGVPRFGTVGQIRGDEIAGEFDVADDGIRGKAGVAAVEDGGEIAVGREENARDSRATNDCGGRQAIILDSRVVDIGEHVLSGERGRAGVAGRDGGGAKGDGGIGDAGSVLGPARADGGDAGLDLGSGGGAQAGVERDGEGDESEGQEGGEQGAAARHSGTSVRCDPVDGEDSS